jgi:hypothetical protein
MLLNEPLLNRRDRRPPRAERRARQLDIAMMPRVEVLALLDAERTARAAEHEQITAHIEQIAQACATLAAATEKQLASLAGTLKRLEQHDRERPERSDYPNVRATH